MNKHYLNFLRNLRDRVASDPETWYFFKFHPCYARDAFKLFSFRYLPSIAYRWIVVRYAEPDFVAAWAGPRPTCTSSQLLKLLVVINPHRNQEK